MKNNPLKSFVVSLAVCLGLGHVATLARAQSLLANGGFENPPGIYPYQTFTGTAMPGWVVENGTVEITAGTYWQAAEGAQSLDLNGVGDSIGTIYQDVPTVPGQAYRIRFAYAGNPECGSPTIKSANVFWNSQQLAALTFDITGHTVTNLGWTYVEYIVAATNTTSRLRFQATSPTFCGLTLDDVSLTSVPCVMPPSGLVGWWKADGNTLETIGGNNGVNQNITYTNGVVGQAFACDPEHFPNGTYTGIRIADQPAYALTNSLTIEGWIRPRGDGYIIFWRGDHRPGLDPYTLSMQANHTLRFEIGDAVGNYAYVDSTVSYFAWTHVAATLDGASGALSIYTNGVLAALTNTTVRPFRDLLYDQSPGIGIGNLNDGGNNFPFTGDIDEIALYSRALAPLEIQTIYYSGSGGKCPPLTPPTNCVPVFSGNVAWWPAEGNANDFAGRANGVLEGGISFGVGEVRQAFSFNDTNADVRIPASPTLNVGASDGFTVEGWVNPSDVSRLQPIVEWNNGAGSWGVHLFISTDAGPGSLYANVVDSNGGWHQMHTSIAPLTTEVFQHVALTYDKASGVGTIYCNGVVVGQTNLGSFTPLTTYDVYLGRRPSGGPDAYTLAGFLDEISLYNRALTASEIRSIFDAAGSGKCWIASPPVPPSISSQPTSLTTYVGSNATFRVTVGGDLPLSYQWYYISSAIFSPQPLTRQTSPTLTLGSVQLTNAGGYAVIVTNAAGSVTSSVALLTVLPLPACTPPPSGLVSWWRAEENTQDAWDSNDGSSLQSGTGVGKVGRAFNLPSYPITVPDSASLRMTNAMTIELWVKPAAVSGTVVRTILSKFDYPPAQPSGTQSSYLLGTTNNGYLFFTVSATGSARTNTTLVSIHALPTNQWSHVAAVYDGSTLRLFINGQEDTKTNYSGGIFPGTAPLGIGVIPLAGSSVLPFYGLLDEISLYNRALSEFEIRSIYESDFIGKCLVAPTITLPPQSQTIPLGEDVKFTVSVLGSRPLKYQWRRILLPSGPILFPGPIPIPVNIVGATNATLVLEKVGSNQVGLYSVLVSNAVGSNISANATLTLSPAPICTSTPDGLISWWPMDTLRSNVQINPFGDTMGTNNIVSFSESFGLTQTGKVAQAFRFNGLGTRAMVNSSASLNFGGNADFSIEMWIKTPLTNTTYPSVPLMEKRDGGTVWAGYSLSLNQGRLAFAMGTSPISANNVSTFISTGPDVRDGMFHHVAVTVNRTNTTGGNLYVDGQLVLTFDPTPRKGSLTTQTPLYMGAPSTTLSNSYFLGLIDEPAIYSRALSAAEILAIRNAGAAGKCKVPPSILTQPVSQKVTAGSNFTFSVSAAGSPLLRYQWLRSGQILIPGATNSVYVVTNVQSSAAGTYTVRVTNLFGSVISSNAVLTVNHAPLAIAPNVTLDEDTSTNIGVAGFDSDGNPLTFTIVTPPLHGTLGSITTSPGDASTFARIPYTPATCYSGPDSFMFTVYDGLSYSAPATVSINVVRVNNTITAQSQSVVVNMNNSLPILLVATNTASYPLTYTVGVPAHGKVTGTPPNLEYTPDLNYYGPDSFTFSASDCQTNSDTAIVGIKVNHPPLADIGVSPLSVMPGVTNLLVISTNNLNATVVLDGSESSDPDGDPLTYSWSQGTNAISTDVAVTNVLPLDSYTFDLEVSDGWATNSASVAFEVINASQSVYLLIGQVQEANLGRSAEMSLLATLKSAASAFDRDSVTSALSQLAAFQNKVHAQITRRDAELARELIDGAQAIIDRYVPPHKPLGKK